MSENESSKRIKLTVEGGPTREFPGDRTFVVGRSQNADFSIPHPNLSREHARFSLRDGEVWMEDLGSANGTFVQGQKIPPKSLVKIKPHYRILLGTGSNVVISVEAVEAIGTLPDLKPKGDLDLPSTREKTLAAIARHQSARDSDDSQTGISRTDLDEKSLTQTQTQTQSRSIKMELDFPKEHFPQEAKKEKLAELRIIEAKKQRVIEDIQYKEREVEDLRSKIRQMREESLKLKEQIDSFRKDLQQQSEEYRRVIDPLAARKEELTKCVAELDVIYEEKIDSLESGFKDLKATLEESHAARMARADKDYKAKTRRLDEEYAAKLNTLESEISVVRSEGIQLRDTLSKEKRELEESLKKVRAEAEKLEADRKLEQVRIETEMAILQGTKLKLETELEGIKRERAKIETETQRLIEKGKQAQTAREDALEEVSRAKRDLADLKDSIEEIKSSEAKNLEKAENLRSELRGLESKRDQAREEVRRAEAEAQDVRRQALEDAERTRKGAAEAAEQMRSEILAQADRESNQRIHAAESMAQDKLAHAKTMAEQIQSAADSHARTLMEKAQADASAIVERARAEADQMISDRNREAADLLENAKSQALEIEKSSRSAAERSVSDANAALDARKATFESELAEARRRNEQEMRQVRASALAEIENAKERETREFNQRLKSRVKSIGDQLEKILGSKLVAKHGVTMDAATAKAFSEEIHQIVETVIGAGKSTGQTKTNLSLGDGALSKILPVADSHAQERVVQYWKKVGVAASIIFVLLSIGIVAPEIYSKLGGELGKALEVKDNTDVMVKRMLRERQLAMTFVTEQNQVFKDSYTDNILYTEGFIEMKEDIETQKSWTLGLNKFMQSELGLTEKAIVQFGSAEGRMVRELLELRKSIIPTNSVQGIGKMRTTEASYMKEIKFVFRTDANWQKFQKYHRDFYFNYSQTQINRSPAQTSEP